MRSNWLRFIETSISFICLPWIQNRQKTWPRSKILNHTKLKNQDIVEILAQTQFKCLTHNWAKTIDSANIQLLGKTEIWWILCIIFRLKSPWPSWTRIKIPRKWGDFIRNFVSLSWKLKAFHYTELKKLMCMIFCLRCQWFLKVESTPRERVWKASLLFPWVVHWISITNSPFWAWMMALKICSRFFVVSWTWDFFREATTNSMRLLWNNILILSTTVFLMMTLFWLISLLPSHLWHTEKLSVFPRLRLAKSIRNSSTCMIVDKDRLLRSLPTRRKLPDFIKIVLLTEFPNCTRETIMTSSEVTKSQLEGIQDLLIEEETPWSAKEADMPHLEEDRSQNWDREASSRRMSFCFKTCWTECQVKLNESWLMRT